MTTHVFIVDDNTFQYHLEYMFAGTGSGERTIDFNNSKNTKLHHSTENSLVSMMADGCRIRKNDLILFYLQARNGIHEGMFFGVFQAVSDGIFLDNFDEKQFLYDRLGKSLTFRLQIKPYEVYSKGVTEWSALDEIKNIFSPYQMLWSLIYRKLKGNRGNTMVTIYEADRLISLIRSENNNKELKYSNCGLSYDSRAHQIVQTKQIKKYTGRIEKINILPRLIKKYGGNKSHEAHLQMYIMQTLGLGINKSLDEALELSNKKIEWLGNEVSCGVGMQRIDVMLSAEETATKRFLYPIELKTVPAHLDNTRQLTRYIDWIEQYYIPNRISIIQPVLICKKEVALSNELKENFNKFNKRKGVLPLKYIEYTISNNQIIFTEESYQL